ncbi:hypothetical protein THF5G08_350010 [Vibrio jasicida]|nr:hypothetical protein THF5G08_350010 [Vibrio jasicida]
MIIIRFGLYYEKNDDSKSKYHGRLSIDKQLKLAGLKEQT